MFDYQSQENQYELIDRLYYYYDRHKPYTHRRNTDQMMPSPWPTSFNDSVKRRLSPQEFLRVLIERTNLELVEKLN